MSRDRAVIITCPHCRTRYRVAADAISAAGRQVLCAACDEAWLATPILPDEPASMADFERSADEITFTSDDDTLFSEADEAMLDSRFIAYDGASPRPHSAGTQGVRAREDDRDNEADGEALPHDPALAARRKALARRRRKIDRTTPLARFRRASRLIAAGALALVLVVFFGFRTEVVRWFPEFGMLYERIGLGTNIVGLDFSDVRTLKTTRDGVEMLMVAATLSNVTGSTVVVPPVIVSLVDDQNQVIYEWSVTPAERQVARGGVLGFETQLTAPPSDIERVRLTFAHGQNRLEPGARAGMNP